MSPDVITAATPAAGGGHGLTLLVGLGLAAVVVAALAVAHLIATSRSLLSAWRQRITHAVLVLPVLVVLAWVLGAPLPWQLPVTMLVLAVALVWRRYLRTADIVARWGETTRRKSGVASTLDVARTASTWAVRRRGPIVRPSLRHLSRRARLALPTTAVAVLLIRAGLLRVWASIEDVVMVFGPPRAGKTGWLAARIIDAPGACLITSTRPDLHQLVARSRARRGPVYVFNASGLGDDGLQTSLSFDPLQGCVDPVTAVERATDLLTVTTTGGGGDREYWEAQARRVLAALMHAAALGRAEGRDLTMRAVLRWVADPDKSKGEVTSLLRRSTEPAYVQDANQYLSTNDRTRSSITSTIMPALGWLTSPTASAAAAPGSSIDVVELLEQRATIYLIGAPEAQSAPLVSALTGHIAREARRHAARQPSGRLDPNLTLALDEAALMAPPLDDWTSDMGGRGVTIIAAFQSRAQMLARWSEATTAAILNNTGATIVFGGRERSDLDYWSALAGDRDERVDTLDEHGRVRSTTVRKVPVIAPAQLANLPFGRVLVFRRGMPPVVGRARMVWERRDQRPPLLAVRLIRQARNTWQVARARRAALVEVAEPAYLRAAGPVVDLDKHRAARPTPPAADLGDAAAS